MARIRVASNPLRAGGVGDVTYYVRSGEQIVRQRKNNSNYGEAARRSLVQQLRRSRWGNLVNAFKTIKAWQPKAYETRKAGQTDYNMFMKLNIDASTVSLKKDQVANGCAVWDAFKVSQGSLPPIEGTAAADIAAITTSIACTVTSLTGVTLGALSQNIIEQNQEFQDGDNIAVIAFGQWLDERQYPYANSVYAELTLDTASTEQMASHPLYTRMAVNTDQNVVFSAPTGTAIYVGMAVIHTRKNGSGLQTSTQSIALNSTTIRDSFTGAAWAKECAESYGIDTEVELDPFLSESGSQWLLAGSHTLVGAGDTTRTGYFTNLARGRYRVVLTPSSWGVDELEQQTSTAFYLRGGASEATATAKYNITVGTMAGGASVDPFEFDLQDIGSWVGFSMRANQGVSVEVSIYRQG